MTKGMAAYGGQGLYRGEGTLSPPQRATGPCRPWGGRQAPGGRAGRLVWTSIMQKESDTGNRLQFSSGDAHPVAEHMKRG